MILRQLIKIRLGVPDTVIEILFTSRIIARRPYVEENAFQYVTNSIHGAASRGK